MSVLADIRDKLQDTEGMIARLERDLATNPHLPSILLEIKSLEKRRKKYEEEFTVATASLGIDVCAYRILPETEHVRVAGLASALIDYQSLVSVFYDAVKRGTTKQRSRISAESYEESAFEFGYAFAGSVGFVFTVPNERTLFDNSPLDQSIQMIFDLSRSDQPSQILAFAHQVGPGPISAMYKWAASHVKHGFSVDIQWKRGSDLKMQALIQQSEFARLQAAIAQTSEETTVETTLTGTLLGADVGKRTFRLKPDAGDDIFGFCGEVIDESHTVELPKRYTATLRVTTKLHYATDQEDISYALLRLEPA